MVLIINYLYNISINGAIMNLFVGNLAKATTEDTLMDEFSAFGKVKSVKVIVDHATGESKGFGFVEMFAKEEAEAAMNELNGKDIDGRKIAVNEARPKTNDRPMGGGFNRGGNGGGGRKPSFRR